MNAIVPLYDNEDSVCGIIYNEVPYYFLKNQQGDIIAITDNTGKDVARYSYDAWGVCTVTQDNSGCDIANINPFRYRGYYFDKEIGMYYLQSRYYDPTVGRFVNSDEVETFQNEFHILENNLYTYCHNRPTEEQDFNGCLAGTIVKKIFLGFLKGTISQLFSDFVVFMYNRLFVTKTAKFVINKKQWLQSIVECVIGELTSLCKNAAFYIKCGVLITKYLLKILARKMTKSDWMQLLTSSIALVLSYFMPKKFAKKRDKRLEKLKEYKKARKKNKKLKNPIKMNKNQINIKYEKSVFRVNLVIDISEMILNAFWSAIPA